MGIIETSIPPQNKNGILKALIALSIPILCFYL